MVGPWGKLEQSTTGAGVEGTSYRLVKFGESILHEVNEWTLLFMCLMGYDLLRFGDEGSDEYRAACGGRAAVVSICGGLLLCPASATVEGQQRVPQKVEVSDGVEWHARNSYAAVDDEVLAALLLDEQAAWVIAHVGHDVWQLAAAGENAVVVSALEEGRGDEVDAPVGALGGEDDGDEQLERIRIMEFGGGEGNIFLEPPHDRVEPFFFSHTKSILSTVP